MLDFHKKAKAEETTEKNMRLFRRKLKMTHPEIAVKLGIAKQAVSGTRPISKELRRSLPASSMFPSVISSMITLSVDTL